MRMTKFMLPAVTLAGALALAGCGGGSDSPGDGDRKGTTTFTNNTTCSNGTRVTGTGSTAAAAAAAAADKCPLTPAETPFAKAGGTPDALLDKDGVLVDAIAAQAAFDEAKKDGELITGLYGSENPGMKWHEALNASKVSLTIGTDNAARTGEGYAIKVTGKKVADVQATGETLAFSDTDKGDVVDSNVVYKGIAGRLICNADNCKAPVEGAVVGDWYFVADDADAEWVKDGENYAARSGKPHADWGVWLSDAGSGTAGKEIQLFRNGGPRESLGLDVVNGLPTTATYNGGAVGVSTLYKSGDDAATVGSFTASAELTATFGTTNGDSTIDTGEHTLKGKITNFRGEAVNTGWELELSNTLLLATGGTSSDGSAAGRGAAKSGSVTGSTWAAQLYGEANKRPSGVVGDFDGRFVDGQAVGVFHAK